MGDNEQPSELTVGDADRSIGTATAVERALIPCEQTYRAGEVEITIRSLKIRDYVRIQEEFSELAQKIATEHPEVDFAHIERHLMAVIPPYLKWIVNTLARLFNLDPNYLMDNLDALDVMRITRKLLEVNQVPVIRGEALAVRELWAGTPPAP